MPKTTFTEQERQARREAFALSVTRLGLHPE